MSRIGSYIAKTLTDAGNMLAAPLLAAAMLLAIGGGVLDGAIIGVPG